MVELPVTIYQQNNQKGITVVVINVLLVISFWISGLQLNHDRTNQTTAKVAFGENY